MDSEASCEDDEDDEYGSESSEGKFDIEEEIRFEKICLNLMNCQNWPDLAAVAKEHLRHRHNSSWKAFFYYGVSMFKQGKYLVAVAAFEKAEKVNQEDA